MVRCRLLPLTAALLATSLATAQDADPTAPTAVAGNEAVAEFIKNYQGGGQLADGSEPTPATEAVKQFEMAPGFEIELVASEPDVSQPLFQTWDSRGRLWVVQYRQYPFPAGLKVLRYDQYLRAVYDRVPEPPPLGISGKDCVSVFEDTDGDGRYDTHQDVITGLNVASSVQIGHGGIWVLNPPYLLFYPDGDHDGLPDGDPQVHLSGFGLEDTHSVANSLLWGPDGWLYGANGSTTVGNVSSAVTKGVHFEGQCIWRYHPRTQIFEIYAEGGGNTFSLEIDSKGRVFSGTNHGGSRGFYYPQGSYGSKNWGKHGPLTNPYAFGYLNMMPCEGDDRRFPQAFAIYEGGLFPSKYQGDILAPNSLHNLIWDSQRIPDGSSYRTVDRPDLCRSPDRWFRPVHAGVGPDGALYIADWYDTRLSHASPRDDWHKISGRVYRIFPTGTQPAYTLGDLQQLPTDQLIDLFSHPNRWVRQRAVLEIGWRGDTSRLDRLVALVEQDQSLEALWAINLLGQLDADRAAQWLNSDSEHIRRWVVRLMGDRQQAIEGLAELAGREPQPQVRSQLAATAKRIPTAAALPVIRRLVEHSQDLSDPQLPLMIWWAVEAHAQDWPQIRQMLADSRIWELPMMQQHIAGRLMQRYATDATAENLQRCAELMELAPDAASHDALMGGLTRAFQGRTIPPLPDSLARAVSAYQESLGNSGLVIGLQQRDEASIERALQVLADPKQDLGLRIELARGLGETQDPRAQGSLLKLACGGTSEPALQRVALVAVRHFTDDTIAQRIVSSMGGSISAEHELRDTACRTLAIRPSWAVELLNEINRWRLRPSDVPLDVVQQLRAYRDAQLSRLVDQAFGPQVTISNADKERELQRLQEILSQGEGNAEAGKEPFAKKCGICHKLFGEGNAIGPQLDAYERGNLQFWLIAVLEPSAEIREGFQSVAVLTSDGRLVTGMVEAQDGNAITIRGSDNQTTTIAAEDVEDFRALPTSLMPEDVLKELTDQQIRDLFAYAMQGARR